MTESDRLCEAGNEKMDRGEAAAALADYDAAIRLDPRHLLAHVSRAVAHADLGHPEAAEADFGRALAIDPASEGALLQRGLFYGHAGKLAPAIADFDRVLERNPACSAAYFNRGLARLKQRESAKAFRDFELAILHTAPEDPNRSDAHHLRGLILLDQGKRSEALVEIESSLRLAPGDGGKLYDRARVHLALEAWEKAIQDLSACLSAGNFDERRRADALIDRSFAWMATERLPRAVEDLDAALKLAPDDPTALLNRGEAYLQSGRLDLAARDFQRLVELRPDDAEARAYLARIQSTRGK
jgi:tetratricopeptide (TPR) repeat protein